MRRFTALVLYFAVLLAAPCEISRGAYFYAAAAAGGASYLVNQNFEGAGYDNGESWTENGTPDEDYTGVVLKGSQSLRCTGSNYPDKSFTGQTTVYFHCQVNLSAFGNDGTRVQLRDGTGVNVLVGLWINSSGAVRLTANSDETSSSATTFLTDTTYYLWLTYISGGTCVLAMSTTTTRPTVDGSGNFYLERTGSADTAAKVLLYSGGGSADMVTDNVLVSASPIGNNP